METRGFTVRYSARKKKARNNLLEALERKLMQITEEIDRHNAEGNEISNNLTPRLFDYHEKIGQSRLIKQDIDEIRQYKTKGAMVRARKNWLKDGEKKL